MITPAACTPHCRLRPSRPLAVSTTLLDLGVGLVERAELAALVVAVVRRVEDLAERDVLAHHRRRHDLGDAVAHRERVAEHAGGVLDRLLGLDRAVGDDLRDAVVAVLLGDVADDLAAPALVEVHVEVGHRDAVGVEEALEDQPVLERVEVGDAHRVGDHRAGARPAARADPDAVVLGPVDEVGDDEEVAGEVHLLDDADLVVGLALHLVRDAAGKRRCRPARPPCRTRCARSRPRAPGSAACRCRCPR